jgi:hypothetical protein
LTEVRAPGRTGADVRIDLRRAPLAAVRSLDLRSPDRDFWADEQALWDRFSASWAGLDDAAWRLPGAAPSDAGGPDWSLGDHIGHFAMWQDVATDYTIRAESTGVWPSDDDFDGGDFDLYNERHREPWASRPPAEIRVHVAAGRQRLLEVTSRLPIEVIRSDDGWGWVYMALHGHSLDHLVVVEPWSERLHERQAEHDPFVPDPRPSTGDDEADRATFWAAEGSVARLFDELVRPVPIERWTAGEVTAGWTLRDHVAHLADWFEEGAVAVEEHATTGSWRSGPTEGFDAWNERALDRRRDLDAAAVLTRHDETLARLRAAAAAMPMETLRTPDGWSWVYECLHGHVRSHLASIGPWVVRLDWPRETA